MNPSFLFLQMFESEVLRRKSSHEPDNSLLSLPRNEVIIIIIIIIINIFKVA